MKRNFLNMLIQKLWIILFFFFPILLKAQSDAIVLVVVNVNSKIYIDGGEVGTAEANKPAKYSTTAGEHYLQAKSISNEKNEASEIVTLESGKQKVLKLEIKEQSEVQIISASLSSNLALTVADLSFNIPGSLVVGTWMANNPDQEYPDYPNFYYAFEKGDEIVIDFSMGNAKGTNVLVVSTYPTQAIKYSNKAFMELKDVRIKVEERSIFRFSLATNHTFDRSCKMKIRRIPASDQTKDFNTTVTYKKVYTPIQVQQTQEFYVNSGSNATFKGGKSRVTFQVNLPLNTVQWYYVFSASRNKEEVQQTSQGFKLLAQLTRLIDQTGTLEFGVNQLTQPSGANYCDIYLLDYNNISPYESKTDYRYILSGTRENLKSGLVKIDNPNSGTWYIGIKNPDSTQGIHVAIEVVAITVLEEYVMEQK